MALWSSGGRRLTHPVRGLARIDSGAAGIGIGVAEGAWLLERSGERVEEGVDLGSLLWGAVAPWRRPGGRAGTVPSLVVFSDTDPASEARYREARRLYARLGIPLEWVKVPGPTAAQNPASLYERLRRGGDGVEEAVSRLRTLLDSAGDGSLQSIQFANSMHGTGMGLNSFLAEDVASRRVGGDAYKLMVVVNADISRASSRLDYLESTRWSIRKLDELLKDGCLDAVLVVDNTVASAVKSVLVKGAGREKLREAWARFMKAGDPYEAVAEFYGVLAAIASLDPHEANDLIVHAAAPLTIIPAWGWLVSGREIREIRASSAPWDYYNVKRVTKGGYIVPGYLPGSLMRQVGFKAIASELAVSTLAPLDPASVTGLIIVLGEEDRRVWERQGISMYTALERSFAEVGYTGPLDVLTLPKESGVWIYAVLKDINILEAKFQLGPWGRRQ